MSKTNARSPKRATRAAARGRERAGSALLSLLIAQCPLLAAAATPTAATTAAAAATDANRPANGWQGPAAERAISADGHPDAPLTLRPAQRITTLTSSRVIRLAAADAPVATDANPVTPLPAADRGVETPLAAARRVAVRIAAADAAADQAAPAAATSAASGTLDEIVVTATRRSAAISKVPISVSAFTQESLDLKGAKDFNDIVRFTPGVTIDSNGTNNIAIRGISSSGGSGTTGIYIDDTPIQVRALGFNADDTLPKAFDVERIEVLRGPQGTLFGAGAEGGAVRYIMAQPKLGVTELYSRDEVSFTRGGAASYETGVAYSTPIIPEELAIRGSIWYRHDGGWINRIDPFTFQQVASDGNYANNIAVRLALKWAPNDHLTVTPSLLYQSRNINDVTVYTPNVSNPGGGSFTSAQPDQRPTPDRYFLPALKIQAELGDMSLISNTSYYSRNELSGYDGTSYNLSYFQTFNNNVPANVNNGTYYPFVDPTQYPLIDGSGLHLPPSLYGYRAPATVTNIQQTFAQEIRLQSDDDKAALQWTAGVFYSVNKQTSIEEINDPNLNALTTTIFGVPYGTIFTDSNLNPLTLLPNGDDYYNQNFSQDKQVALFGEVGYNLTSQWKITAGLRYAKTDVSFNHLAYGPQNFGTTSGSGGEHEKPVTPKLSIAYQADKNDLYYFTYAKGFRIGGDNAPIPVAACAPDLANLGLSAPPDAYKSDTVNSFELGAKNKISDNLRVSSSIYYIKWSGIQQNVYLPGCGFQFTSNFGDAVAQGGDIQIEYQPIPHLSFEFAAGYTDAHYVTDAGTATNLIAARGDAIQGESSTPAPRYTIALGTQYDFTAMDHKAFVRLDYEFRGRNTSASASEDPRTATYDPLVYTPESTKFVSIRSGATFDKWQISAFVDNLFDDHTQFPPSSYAHSDVDPYNPNPPTALITAYTFRPRTIGLTATYHL